MGSLIMGMICIGLGVGFAWFNSLLPCVAFTCLGIIYLEFGD